jgi:hypothetical protein
VSPLAVLFLLLVAAYLGGFLMGGRGVAGRGLPSGSEWVVLGFLVGPSALGVLSLAEIQIFDPVAIVAMGWIALLAGLGYGVSGERRIPALRLAAGAAAGALTGGASAALAWLALRHVPPAAAAVPDAADRIAVAVATGAALSGTTRNAVQWAADRLAARGPLTDLAGDLARGQEVVPIVALGALVVAGGSPPLPLPPGSGAALGAVLGLASALLLGRTLRPGWLWTLLLGMSLVATGAALQLGVSVALALLALGVALALASPLRREIRALPPWLEGAVVVPSLFLAGARVQPRAAVLWTVGAALLGRLAAQAAVAAALALASRPARRAGPALALGLGAAGPVTMVVAVAYAIRFPGPVGDTALLAAAAATIAGEFAGIPALRASLRRAGEAAEAGTAPGGEAPATAPPAGGAA